MKVRACGICRTDMKAFNMGQRDLHLPRILGHEIAGTVVETGAGVICVKPGDRVQVAPGLPCGSCKFCLREMHHLCDHVQVMGFHYDGGFAEYVLVPASGVSNGVLNLIPGNLTFQEAALTEPLACSVNMQETIGVGSGDSVVIFGAGPLGFLNTKLARSRGAGPIILVEVNEERLSRAKGEFDYCINSDKKNPRAIVEDVTGGRGAEVAISCCPEPDVIRTGLSVLAKRGRFGFFSGLVGDSAIGTGDLNLIHYRELSVHGAYGCSSRHNRLALKLLADGAVMVKDMITREIKLEDVLEGLEAVKAMQEISIIINFDA